MTRKPDPDDTMAAFSEMTANLGFEPVSAIPVNDHGNLLFITLPQTPSSDMSFAVDKQNGIELTLSHTHSRKSPGVWTLKLELAWLDLPTAPRPLAEAFAEPLRELIQRLRPR